VSRIFFDSNLFVYMLEKSPFSSAARALRLRMLERGDQLITSTFTLGEILVRPMSLARVDIVDHYQRLFRSARFNVVAFDFECGPIYGRIRQDRSIKPADAIQLACAARAQCDLFVTNDDRLSRKVIPGIHFIVPLDRVYL